MLKFKNILLVVMLLALEASSIHTIITKNSTYNEVQTSFIDLSSNWRLVEKSGFYITNQIAAPEAYWGIYNDTDFDSLNIGCYYKHNNIVNLYLFGESNLKTDLNSIRLHFKGIYGNINRDSINSYLRIFKIDDTIHVAVIAYGQNKINVYKNNQSTWTLKQTFNNITSLLYSKYKNNTAYFLTSDNKLITMTNNDTTIYNDVYGCFPDNNGAWLTKSTGLYYLNGINLSLVRSNQIYRSIKKFAIDPSDTTFFYEKNGYNNKIYNNYFGDITYDYGSSYPISHYTTCIDNNNNLIAGNFKIFSETNYRYSYLLPLDNYDKIYEDTIIINHNGSIKKLIINYPEIYSQKLLIDSSIIIDNCTEDILYSQKIITHDIDNDSSYIYQVVLPSWLSISRTSKDTFMLSGKPNNFTIDTVITIIMTDYNSENYVKKSYDTLVYELSVIKVNDKPIINQIPDLTINFKDNFSYQIIAKDEENDQLTYLLNYASTPSTAKISSNGLITWSPSIDDIGIHIITVEVKDYDLSDIKNFKLTVLNNNETPIITLIQNETSKEGQLYQRQVEAIDDDSDLVYSLIKNPKGMTISQSGLIQWTPTITGTNIIKILVKDIYGCSDSSEYTLLIVNENQKLEVISMPILTGIENQLYSYQVEAIAYKAISYSLEKSPLKMTISENGLVKWMPTISDSGSYQIKIKITDGDSTRFQTYSLKIQNVNMKPVIQSFLKDTFIYETDSIKLKIKAVDLDNSNLNISWYKNNVLVKNGSSYYNIKSTYESKGDYEIKAVVSDGEYSVFTKMKLEIKNKNRAPVCRKDTTIVFNNVDQIIEISSRAIDLDNDELIYTYDTTNFNVSNLVVEIKDSIYMISLRDYYDCSINLIVSDGVSNTVFKVDVVVDIKSTSVLPKYLNRLVNSFAISSKGLVKYSVEKNNKVNFMIFDLKGNVIYKINEIYDSGCYCKNLNLVSGTYVYKFFIGKEYSKTSKIQIVK